MGNRMTSLCDNAFSDTDISNITFGSGIKTIGKSAFEDCARLTTVNLNEGLITVKENAFKDCSELQKISFPDSITTVEENILKGCAKIKEIHIGASLTDLPDDIFGINKSKSELEKYTVSEENSFLCADGFGVLYGCKTVNKVKVKVIDAPVKAELASYSVPETVDVIGNNSFRESNIVTLDLANVRGIDRSAFAYCSDLLLLFRFD